MTTALLLAAGKATRLGALRNQYAKACVPVAGTTPLRFAIERLAQAGVTRVIVNLHWQAEQVRAEASAAVPSGIQLDFLEEDVLFIVLEWAAGGDLKNLIAQIRKEENQLEEHQVWSYFSQCCEAVHHMHGQRIIHRCGDVPAARARARATALV